MTRLWRILRWVGLAVAAAVLGWVIAQVVLLAVAQQETEQALERARERGAERQAAIELLAQDLVTVREAADALVEQVEELGETPRARPDTTTSTPPLSAPPSPRLTPPTGPTTFPREVVRAEVVRYLEANPPAAGAAATAQQVEAAVAAFCADGRCRGASGADAEPGARGERGDQGEPGADAPPVADSQIAALVAAYCDARDQCRGAIGQPGERGAQGERGEPGADSTVPGPEGPAGPPGPACPDGTTLEQRPAPLTSPGETWFVCVTND